MGIRQAVSIAVLLLAGVPGRAEDPSGEYARVEVRAKLYYRDGTLDKPKAQWYEVRTVRETFRLDLPTKDLVDQAKASDKSIVVVAGDLTIETTGDLISGLKREAVIRVTSLRRAEPPKK